MDFQYWLYWALVLFAQNISFTYVSRARSSGSIWRHAKASIFSNGIWIFSQMIMLGPMLEYLTGKHGRQMQIASGVVYTLTTLAGSLFAHWLTMKTEKGKGAVGYSSKYAQIPIHEWNYIRGKMIADEIPQMETVTAPVSKDINKDFELAVLRKRLAAKGLSTEVKPSESEQSNTTQEGKA
jgi:hypothetical protein